MHFIDKSLENSAVVVRSNERVVVEGSFVLDGEGAISSGSGHNVLAEAGETGVYTLTVQIAGAIIDRVDVSGAFADAANSVALASIDDEVATLSVLLAEVAEGALEIGASDGGSGDTIYWRVEFHLDAGEENAGHTFVVEDVDSATPEEP
jgi:hypothetical protein